MCSFHSILGRRLVERNPAAVPVSQECPRGRLQIRYAASLDAPQASSQGSEEGSLARASGGWQGILCLQQGHGHLVQNRLRGPQRILQGVRIHHVAKRSGGGIAVRKDDAGAIEKSDVLVKHDLLHRPRVACRRADAHTASPLQAVDDAAFPHIGISHDADRNGTFEAPGAAVVLEKVEQLLRADGRVGPKQRGVHACNVPTELLQVRRVARACLEGHRRRPAAKVPQPRLQHVLGHQIRLVQDQHEALVGHAPHRVFHRHAEAAHRVPRVEHMQNHVCGAHHLLELPHVRAPAALPQRLVGLAPLCVLVPSAGLLELRRFPLVLAHEIRQSVGVVLRRRLKPTGENVSPALLLRLLLLLLFLRPSLLGALRELEKLRLQGMRVRNASVRVLRRLHLPKNGGLLWVPVRPLLGLSATLADLLLHIFAHADALALAAALLLHHGDKEQARP
mmetsp:Transcript_12959/g.48023  ORF Transcript_12959/g.48023 Transcript_12959/m.48023 type:complete len:450 (+) Transcript_12959:2420-3769(+)